MNQIKVSCCSFAKGSRIFPPSWWSDYRHQYTNGELMKLSKIIDEEAYVLCNDVLMFRGLEGVK
jgi:hypothetical protein